MANELENRREVRTVEQHKRGGLRAVHTLGLIALGVVGVVVAFWALSFIVGIVWGIVKVAVILAVIGAILWFLLHRARR